MTSPRNEIIVGHVLDGLRTIPEESVQCIITSPPYFGLRDYGTQPQIWGGDPTHVHAWTESVPRGARSGGTDSSGLGNYENGLSNKAIADRVGVQSVPGGKSHFCVCGAWRGELGLEPNPALFVDHIVEVFREIRRVLRPDGVVWLNLGDSYSTNAGPRSEGSSDGWLRRCDPVTGRKRATPGLKHKDLVGIPWRVAFSLQEDGWWLRSDVIWAKPNPMPESVTDRPTKSHEYVFLLTKNASYFYDHQAVKEPWVERANDLRRAKEQHPGYLGKHSKGYAGGVKGQPVGDPSGGRNLRTVWQIPTQPFPGAHFATFPEGLAELCIKAGTSENGACATCGAPSARVIQNGEPLQEWKSNSGADSNGEYGGQATKDYVAAKMQDPSAVKARILAGMREKTTVAWRPTCDCPGGVLLPCIVLDPFFGSGTTGLVAKRLGRDFIGCELNEEYAAIAERRLSPVMNHRLEGFENA